MKKISLLLFTFITCISFVNAQTSKPEVSMDDTGPWYYVQVLGDATDGTGRADRVLAGKLDEETGEYLVFGGLVNDATTMEETNKQLWRFEKNEDEEYIIINKYFGKQISIWYWEETSHTNELEKDVASLTDITQTRWNITESNTDGYWLISATHPLNSVTSKKDGAQKYLHQGNTRWGYRIIMEGDDWGTVLESRFQFVPEDDMDLRVLPRNINFGTFRKGTLEEEYLTDTLTVTVYSDLTQDIQFEWTNNDNYFVVPISGEWDNRTGGKLLVGFELENTGVHESVITFSSKRGDKDVKFTVYVTGEILSDIPVNISDDDNESWYYITFPMRWKFGGFMADKGLGEPIIGQDFVENDESQLWKFVAADEAGEYKIISKAGHELDYQTILKGEEEVERFVAVVESANTFAFDLRTDEDWQIKWYQGESRIDDEGNEIPAYINKTNVDDGVGAYAYMPDDGNAVRFIPAEALVESSLPRFSSESKSYWYMIDFERQSGKSIEEVEYNESIFSNVAQRETNVRATSQYWRFVGGYEEFKIESYSGKSLKVFVDETEEGNTYSRIRAVEDEGDLFTFEKGTAFLTWQIRNMNPGDQPSYYYLNDFGGRTICQYGANDGGNDMNFTYVDTAGTGIEDIDNGATGENELDQVVNTYYYTLQGTQIGSVRPTAPGIYIEKRTHQSGKTSARKLLITRN